ncbi:MAG: HEAT repeat domain-containing protein [Myxococcota bacterium]
MAEATIPDAALLDRLGSADRGEQRLACDRLAERLADSPELRDALLTRLRDGSRLERFAAAFVLFATERPTLRLLPALLDALEIADGDIRWQATHMLTTLGRMQAEVLPVVLHEARSAQNPVRRRMALYALRELAPERPETAQTCQAALDDPTDEVRRAALTCFGKLSGAARPALDRVLAIARGDPDPRMRGLAAVALSHLVTLHPEARPAVSEAIRELSRSADPGLARAAGVAAARLEASS